MSSQLDLFAPRVQRSKLAADAFVNALRGFAWYGKSTAVTAYRCSTADTEIPVFTNEFWTSDQRAAHSLHEISYRACFKPQLPRFFLDRLSEPGDTVFDPFAGRGTTLLEAALNQRTPAGCDINPLSRALILPRLDPPTLGDVQRRLSGLSLRWTGPLPEDLLTFYHSNTLSQICALREHLMERDATGTIDAVDEWIRMVTLNRLTGHSPGFLSVYTLPPNQAVSVKAQRKINADRGQTPPERDLKATILKKTKSLLADVDDPTREVLRRARAALRFHIGSSTDEFWGAGSVQLVVTSPPFLNVVDYAEDNWLRCWFSGISADNVPISLHSTLEAWQAFVSTAFRQFIRLLRPGGFIAFEVGEVRGGRIRLEETVIPAGILAGACPVAILLNEQVFTKTANIWGVANNRKGTNTNRIVVFCKN
ncbi:MAG TPA: DNA methyltransferase [Vicinamibacterales bacterium]|nr:DNA methyltransferase [Vicinamibacterales bacterium]